jgi:hypothetical protein
MYKALSALAIIAGIGIAAMIEPRFWPADEVISKTAGSLIDGIIIGSTVWYYNAGWVPGDVDFRLKMWSSATVPSASEMDEEH